MKKRNSYIDLLKFLFALALIIYHGRLISETAHPLFQHGYFAVEFFFIVSGYYMCKTAIEKKTDYGPFITQKYLGFFPYHIFSFILAFCATLYVGSLFTYHDILKLSFAAVPEFLIVPTLAGLKFDLANINGIEWYLAAMLLAMALIYPLLKKAPKYFCVALAPLLFLFISGYLFNVNDQSYNTISDWNGFMCLGVLRAVAEVAIGCTLYYVTSISSQKKDSSLSRLFFTLADLACWIIVFGFMTSELENSYEFTAVYFVIAGLYLVFSGKTLLAIHINSRFLSFLGKLSFPMFLNQSWIRKVFIHLDLKLSYTNTELLFVGSVIAVSLLCIVLVDPIVSLIRNKRKAATA